LNVKPAQLHAWETGVRRPTIRQAEKVARQLHVPFGYLFLSAPPAEAFPLPDLRTVRDQTVDEPSPELRDVVNDAIEKQDWYRDYLTAEGAMRPAFIGRFSLEDAKPETIASDIRSTIGLTASVRAEARDWDHFLSLFIGRVEQTGILVLRSGIVGTNTHRPLAVAEFRGFVISDAVAPLVFLNGADARSAQIFTLAQELVHLWIDKGGVLNPDYEKSASGQINLVERLCSRTAAEILLPTAEFLASWNPRVGAEDNVRDTARLFRVSSMAALRQAFDLELIDGRTYSELFSRMAARARHAGRESGGGNFYRTLLARNSRVLTATLIAAAQEGRVTFSEAARLLGVKVPMLDRVAQAIASA
jgi:Zn-dependent peptidase ImmA (M78 family)